MRTCCSASTVVIMLLKRPITIARLAVEVSVGE